MANETHSKGSEIRIWPFDKAPKELRKAAPAGSEWLAVIPVSLLSHGIEALFWRWHSDDHPVSQRVLADGSLVLAGSYPTAATLTLETIGLEAQNRAPHARASHR
jgi:hypothetical protein